MKRRAFIAGVTAAAAPALYAQAQQAGRNYRIAVLAPSGRQAPPVVAFFEEWRRSGFIEGHNLTVTSGGFGVGTSQYAELTVAMVRAAPDVIVTDAGAGRILKELTRTIPMVAMGEDILADGLVDSLARPSGNITGVSILSYDLDGKRQDLLLEAVPQARHIGALVDGNLAQARHLQRYKDAARGRGVELSLIEVRAPHEIGSAVAGAKAAGVEALNVLATPLFASYQTRGVVLQHVAAVGLPAIYQWPDMAEDGGFMGYGPDFVGLYRQRARMVVKVLLGSTRHVPCEAEFLNGDGKEDVVGDCYLTHYESKEGMRPDESPMMLHVSIDDPNRKYQQIVFDMLRDAAVSGHRFCHIEMKTDRVDGAEAIRAMRERGYGPRLRIHHLKMWPRIQLPNAPRWAFEQE